MITEKDKKRGRRRYHMKTRCIRRLVPLQVRSRKSNGKKKSSLSNSLPLDVKLTQSLALHLSALCSKFGTKKSCYLQPADSDVGKQIGTTCGLGMDYVFPNLAGRHPLTLGSQLLNFLTPLIPSAKCLPLFEGEGEVANLKKFKRCPCLLRLQVDPKRFRKMLYKSRRRMKRQEKVYKLHSVCGHAATGHTADHGVS